MGRDGKVLTDHRAMGWLGWDGKVLTDHRAMGWLGWVGKVLTDHRAMGWLGWKGPGWAQRCGMNGLGWKGPDRSQSYGVVGLGWEGPLCTYGSHAAPCAAGRPPPTPSPTFAPRPQTPHPPQRSPPGCTVEGRTFSPADKETKKVKGMSHRQKVK